MKISLSVIANSVTSLSVSLYKYKSVEPVFRHRAQWRSDAVRGPGSSVRSGPQGPLQWHSPEGLWVRDKINTEESFKGINAIIDIMKIAAQSIVKLAHIG